MGELVPFPIERERGKRRYRAYFPIQIPDMIQRDTAKIGINASREDIKIMFRLPLRDGETVREPTKENVAEALVAGEQVECYLNDQRKGDTVFVSYIGITPKNGITYTTRCYNYTQDRGWQNVQGTFQFNAGEGPDIKQ